VEARLLAHKPNLDRYAFAAERPFVARFQTFYFPGWRATLDGEPVDIQIAAPYGLIEVPIPAGEHEMLLCFGETPLRQLADPSSPIVAPGSREQQMGGRLPYPGRRR